MRFLTLGLVLAGCGGNNLNQNGSPDMSIVGPGAGEFGALCADASQCNSGICLTGRCSHSCPFPMCEMGWICGEAQGQPMPVCQCPAAGPEMCDGLDNDCNGVADDNASCPPNLACVKATCICQTPTGSFHAKWVTDTITLPESRSDYAVDLNGDGKPDNQYGNIIGALQAAGSATPQSSVNAQILAGQILLLVDERSNDGSFLADPCAGATVVNAKSQPAPDLSGSGSFTTDATASPGDFKGAFTTSNYASISALLTTTPVSLTVRLPLMGFGSDIPPTTLPITAAQVKLDSAHRGQLNGVLRKEDLDHAL